MNNSFRKIFHVAIAVLFTFLIAGCSDLIKPNSTSISVSFPENNARSVVNQETHHYSISLLNKDKTLSRPAQSCKPGNTFIFQNLEPGTYSIIVEGWSAASETDETHIYTTDEQKSDKSVTVEEGDSKTYNIVLKAFNSGSSAAEISSISVQLTNTELPYSLNNITVTAACSDGSEKTLSYSDGDFSVNMPENAYGLVPVTITENLSGTNLAATYYAETYLELTCGTLSLSTPQSASVTEYETATFSVSDFNQALYQSYTFYLERGSRPAASSAATVSYKWTDVTDSTNVKQVADTQSFTTTGYDTAGSYTFQCNATITKANNYVKLTDSQLQNLQVSLTVTAAPAVYTSAKVSDFISAVEAVTDTSNQSVFAVYGTLSLTEPVNIKGNVKIIVSSESAEFTRDSSNSSAMFDVASGATLTIAGDYPLTLNGQNKSSSTALIVNSGNVVLNEQVTITNASCSNSSGAAAILTQSDSQEVSLTIGGTTISDCTSSGYLVYCWGTDSYKATVDISDMTVSGNSCTAGSFFMEDNTSGSIKNTEFSENTVTAGNGGAINITVNSSNTISVSDCTFISNSINDDYEGAAVYIGKGKVTVKDSTFADNLTSESEISSDIYYNNESTDAELHLMGTISLETLRINKCNGSSGKIYLDDSFSTEEAVNIVLTNTSSTDFVSGTQLVAKEDTGTKTLSQLITDNISIATSGYTLQSDTGKVIK